MISIGARLAGMAAAVHHRCHALLGLDLHLHLAVIKEEVAREQGIRHRRAGRALVCPIARIAVAVLVALVSNNKVNSNTLVEQDQDQGQLAEASIFVCVGFTCLRTCHHHGKKNEAPHGVRHPQ